MSAPGSLEASADKVCVEQDGETVEPTSYNDKMFTDGCREIDYILVYKKQKTGEVDKDNDKDKDKVKEKEKETQNETFRKTFIKNLEQIGLEFEYQDHTTLEGHAFVKIHIPWRILLQYAEVFKLKMPISENDIIEENPRRYCRSLKLYLDYDREELPKLQNFFTTMFSRTSAVSFLLKENEKERFFTPAQRSLLVWLVLSEASYEDNEDSSLKKIGIHRLIYSKTYLAAFPLHSGPKTQPDGDVSPNLRAQLSSTWARKKRCYQEQPFDHIRLYFGERIAMYFCLVGFYTKMLSPVALIGLCLFCVSAGIVRDDVAHGVYVNEICDESGPGKTIMCPTCDHYCPYWRLCEACLVTGIAGLFDNYTSVAFAAVMALWSSLFLELWKRRQAHIQFRWHVDDFYENEQIRPEYQILKAKTKENPVKKNNHVLKRFSAKIVTSGIIAVVLSVVAASVFGVVVYRVAIQALLYNTPEERSTKGFAHWTTIATAAVINLVFILSLEPVYRRLAFKLTDYERHRTQSEWENSYILKVFLFEFINQNAALLYIAFLKGRFIGHPDKYSRILGFRPEACGPEGCLLELVTTCVTIFAKTPLITLKNVLKIKYGNTKWKLAIPSHWEMLKFLFMRKKEITVKKETKEQMESDFMLSKVTEFELINEYIEMVLQYANVTVYSAAVPLGPMLALANNIIEIRVDAKKFVERYRRPVARRAQDIGIWYGIIKAISIFAVLSNATIIATTSDLIPRYVYQNMFNTGQVNVTYTMFTLSVFNVSQFEEAARPNDPTLGGENVTLCYYQGYRQPPAHDHPYELTLVYWKILSYRLLFIISFSIGIGLLGWLISALIPAVPKIVKKQLIREKQLAHTALIKAGKKFKTENARECEENCRLNMTI